MSGEKKATMQPHEIYNLIEAVWKESALQTMVLELIVSGSQAPNPEAFTYAQQHTNWNKETSKLRIILDELEALGKAQEIP